MGAIKRFIDFIKHNFLNEEKELSDFEKNVVPNLKFGDIIYAKRFYGDNDKLEFGEGHETGPFVVIKTEKNRVIGCYCTSSENCFSNMAIDEDHQLFHRTKLSFVDTCNNIRVIDEDSFLGVHVKSLSSFDKERLLKALTLNGNRYYFEYGSAKKLELEKKALVVHTME